METVFEIKSPPFVVLSSGWVKGWFLKVNIDIINIRNSVVSGKRNDINVLCLMSRDSGQMRDFVGVLLFFLVALGFLTVFMKDSSGLPWTLRRHA